jgi:two-component system, cell cycle response regulator
VAGASRAYRSGIALTMQVVVAHSEARTRERLARVLERAGQHVQRAATADEALAACRAGTHVAVVDVRLCHDGPGGLLRRIKADADAFGTAVVLLERDELDLEAASAALRRGVQDFLVEPVGDGELLARVTAAGRTKVLQEELFEQTRRLEGMIFEDALTGLANRRYILTQLGSQVSAARRHGRPLSAAIVDIDHFKAVNDLHGHQAGDSVLIAVAAALNGHLRAEDQIGRLGGEEFLIVLPDTDAEAVERVTDKLRCEVGRASIAHDGHALAVTVSIGMATWCDDELPEELLRRADHALYAAKAAGRDRALSAPATVPRRT